MTTPSEWKAAIALNRFGLGVRPDEPLPADPGGWLLAQFEREPLPAPWAAGRAAPDGWSPTRDYQRGLRQATAVNEVTVRQTLNKLSQERYRAAVNARVASALVTRTPFPERLAHFWANHFAVSIDKTPLAALAGAFEVEAIRPHVFGRFEDMLVAVERHPAMLLYLDQARSIGPGSIVARRASRNNPERARGLNENLARDIMELHTLGVRSGYSQEDVTELARALTGWSVSGLPGLPALGTPGAFVFQPLLHEPGARSVLGKGYERSGETQASAILHDLAVAPATARHIAAKLARHFAGDTPAPALVDRLADAFMQSRGDLPTVYRALIDSPEAWNPAQSKFKTPWEWTLSSLRALSLHELRGRQFAPLLTQLGQPAWRPGSPAGFDDTAASWMAPDALMRRVEFAQGLAAQAGSGIDARELGPKLLPAGLTRDTTLAIARAESPATALALLLASPEFLRR
ncbi:MAG: DUF1800 domain-containing protein [Betaproteobacteria bacterium]|nr:DUF1800 domain-containing protein [Betaproteobacteria bacterium]